MSSFYQLVVFFIITTSSSLFILACSPPPPQGIVPPPSAQPVDMQTLTETTKLLAFEEESFSSLHKTVAEKQQEIIKKYERAYHSQQRKRVALYFNYQGETIQVPLTKTIKRTFEATFTQAFLTAHTTLIDLHEIIKIVQVEAGNNIIKPYPSVKTVMNALRDKADLLIEVTVIEEYAAPEGYLFKATVTGIDNGQLWATSDFSINAENTKTALTLSERGLATALNLMKSLTQSWSHIGM